MQCHAIVLDTTGHDRHNIRKSKEIGERKNTGNKQQWWLSTQKYTEAERLKAFLSKILEIQALRPQTTLHKYCIVVQ